QPLPPNVKGVMLDPPELLESRKCQVMVLGSTAPMVVLPSPFQSPTTGSQLAPPNVNGVMLGEPLVLVVRSDHVAVFGSKTPAVEIGVAVLMRASWNSTVDP